MCHAQSKFSSPGVPRLGIPEIWMSDGPHGVRAEIEWDSWSHAGWTNDSITAFPALTCLAATFNPDLSADYGLAIGEEARYREKDILLGPGVNIYRTPLCGRNFEYMGEDPYLASVMVVPYIKGVQKSGVAACVKHYVLNNQEKWRGHISVEVSDRALREIYLPAFKAAVKEGGVWSLMGAYNQFRGQHASHNETLHNILKGEWKFDGVVVTDWGSAHNTKEAALYGIDIEMGTGTDGLTTSTENAYDYYYLANPFYDLLKKGEIDQEVLNEKVRRILRLSYRTNLNKNRPFGRMNNEAHHQTAYNVASEGIVLLKNEDNFFPLKSDTEMTIAVIGENSVKPMTVGGGSSELKAQYEISPLAGIKSRFPKAKILHSLGYASGPSVYGRVVPSKLNQDSLKIAALDIAKKADLVLFVGGLNKNHQQDCEGDDRKSFSLPFGQETLIDEIHKLNDNFAVLLVSGNAVKMDWLPKAKAVFQVWYLGSETGNALADVLIGKTNPSGKLPFTFPVNLEDNAAHHFGQKSYPGDGKSQTYMEDILVGYRWHDTKDVKPQFAFGFGLSYTQFEIENISVNQKAFAENETIKVSCTVKNTGKRDGKEVVQVYAGKHKSKVERAQKELKAFKKVKVNKASAESVTLEIKVKDLAFYNEETSSWEVEKGDYFIYVGNSSDNISKKLKISVK